MQWHQKSTRITFLSSSCKMGSLQNHRREGGGLVTPTDPQCAADMSMQLVRKKSSDERFHTDLIQSKSCVHVYMYKNTLNQYKTASQRVSRQTVLLMQAVVQMTQLMIDWQEKRTSNSNTWHHMTSSPYDMTSLKQRDHMATWRENSDRSLSLYRTFGSPPGSGPLPGTAPGCCCW